MTLLTWNHSCGVGVRAMDDQHGILMDTMNELRLAVVSGRGREQMSELLDRLIEFTRMHFWSEEQLLEQSGFPGLAAHRAAHHSLLAQMLEAAHRVQYGKGVEMNSLLCWLQDTYAEHTEGLDRRAIAFGFLLTAEVRKNSGSVGFRLHLVLICPHTAPEMAVFGITKLD
ncbi:MAG: bacteriohemerythrin, partial [Terracidiphilus sp.]|nr:bacteriohemerythrin [Terracidiphilus sp.]